MKLDKRDIELNRKIFNLMGNLYYLMDKLYSDSGHIEYILYAVNLEAEAHLLSEAMILMERISANVKARLEYND